MHKEWLRFKPGIDCVAAAFTPDGKRLATGGDTGIITLWDAATGQEVLTLRGHSDAISRLTFSAHGRFLASSNKDGSVRSGKRRDDNLILKPKSADRNTTVTGNRRHGAALNHRA